MRKKSYSLKHRITGFLLAAAVVATGSLSFNIPAKAAEENPGYINAYQINWTGNELLVYDSNGNTVEHTYTVGGSLALDGASRINVKSDASGSLTSLTLKSGTYIHVENGANVSVGALTNESTGGSFGRGVSVAEGGKLNCSSVINRGTIQLNGEMALSGSVSQDSGSTYVVSTGAFTGRDFFAYGGLVDNAASITCTGMYEAKSDSSVTKNNGTITCNTFEVGTGLQDSAASQYKVTTSFKKGNVSMAGTVIPNNTTLEANEAVSITSAGGTTKVKLDGVTKVRTDAIDNETAGLVVPEAEAYIYDSSPTYYGMDISNYTSRFGHVPAEASCTIQYAETGTEDKSTTVPTELGSYDVYATITGSEEYGYRPIDKKVGSLYRDYLPNSGVSGGIPRATLTSDIAYETECPFFKDKLTLDAPEGYKFINDDGEYEDTLTVSDEGYYNGVQGQYKVVSDSVTAGGALPFSLKGAVTESRFYYTPNFYVDTNAPKLGDAVDQDGNEIVTAVEEGNIVARSADLVILDKVDDMGNLKAVTLDGTTDGVTAHSNEAQTVHLEMDLPGKKTFTIRAEDWVGHTKSWTVNMTYLPTKTPDIPYTIDATEGKNGFYTSDITLIPADGYRICDSLNGEFTYALKLTSGTERIYLQKISNGAYTDAIPVDAYKIDKTMPTFYGAYLNGDGKNITGEVKDDEAYYYTKKLNLTVKDENLFKVSVKKEGSEETSSVPVTDGSADLILATLGKETTYYVTAEDLAGNTITKKIRVDHQRTIAEAKIAIADYYYGMKPNPQITSNSDLVSEATVYYKAADANGSYVSDSPLSVGRYIAKVIVPMSDDFTEAQAETEFRISYLPTPETPYTLSGTEGKNKYYTSDVELVAPEGYKIASSVTEEGSRRAVYTEGMNGFYLRRTDDGATTDFIPITETIKIDKEIPVLAGSARDQDGQSVGIVHGTTYMADTMTFTITDDHLKWLTINGVKTEVFGGKAVVSLDAKKGIREFVIAAEDEAGNVYNVTVTLMATWYRDKIIPIGAPVPLSTGEIYKLGGGIWRVNEGQTLYPGGGSFCVVIPGDYTFVTTE